MRRIFRTPFQLLLPASVEPSLGSVASPSKSFGRMSHSGDKGEYDAANILQRYSMQKSISEGCRVWKTIVPQTGGRANDFQFTFMSYNILAQELLEIHDYHYTRHDSLCVKWSHRYDRLITEINVVKPDILCLQELQESHKDQFSKGLANFNYELIYKKRTGDKPDGCAIYFRRDLFHLLEYQQVEYFQPNVTRLNRENVAIIAKLALQSNPSQKLVVATTHLLYNPRRQDVRLAQVQVLLAELDRLAYVGRYENGTPKYAPTIVCGDFNLQPYSAPYVLMTTGFLQYDKLMGNALEPDAYNARTPFGKQLLPKQLGITDDCRHESLLDRIEPDSNVSTKLSYCNTKSEDSSAPNQDGLQSKANFNRGTLKHCFKFTSVHRHNIGRDNEEATTFQNRWITVDYIFYTKFHNTADKSFKPGKLKLISIYTLPNVRQAKQIYAIPNMYFGSDHFALAARFSLAAENSDNQ